MASKSTEHSAVKATLAEVAASGPEALANPQRPWIAQIVWHSVPVRLARTALEHHVRGCDDVIVAMELAVYYIPADKRARLWANVQVVFGVGRRGEQQHVHSLGCGQGTEPCLEVAPPSTADSGAPSRVLGLDLRTERRNGATVLAIHDSSTGEEVDGALEGSERQRRVAEEQLTVARDKTRTHTVGREWRRRGSGY